MSAIGAELRQGGWAMHRLMCFVVIGALAVVVCVVAAGPAVAAKGGNSANAHACQQGGFANRFDGESGRPFTNAGDCANNGAQGQPSAFLALDVSAPYPCTDTNDSCWGRLDAGGLADEAPWEVENASTHAQLASGNADSTGSVNDVILNLSCSAPAVVQISSTTSSNATISQLVETQGVC
jgi:hypothetical protein